MFLLKTTISVSCAHLFFSSLKRLSCSLTITDFSISSYYCSIVIFYFKLHFLAFCMHATWIHKFTSGAYTTFSYILL
jgi:hypothetical protein